MLTSCGGSQGSSPSDPTGNGGTKSSGGSPSTAGAEANSSGGAPKSGDDASAGGSGADDAGATGSPGGAATSSSGDAARYEACSEYILAFCARRDACGGGLAEASCNAANLPYCPDLLFSDGSTVRVDTAQRCAEAWRDADCADIARGVYPNCGFQPGTIQTGLACAFNTQCETLACGGYGEDDCGVCVPVLNKGDVCGGAQGVCPSGTECSGTCQPAIAFNLPAGSACKAAAQCEDGYVCRASAQGGQQCQPLVELGDPCAGSWECREGHCDAASNQCTPSAPIGTSCSEDGWGHLRGCEGAAICDARSEPTVCVERVSAGKACWLRSGLTDHQGNCQDGLDCSCLDAKCGQRECRFLRQAGEPCNDPQALCVRGTACRGGICDSTGSQGLFDAACKP